MKFNLREQIQRFEYMVSMEEERAGRLREKAREQALSNSTKAARATLKEVIEREKKAANISTRKRLLEDTLTQL